MIPLPVASYSDPPASAARLINCYVEQASPQGKGPVIVNGAPGISAFRNSGTGVVRAAHVVQGTPYCVVGDGFLSFGASPASIGSVVGSARPQIADNGTQIVVLIAPRAWLYTIATGAFTEITDTDFTSRGASSVQFIDNYFSFTDADSGRWFISALADGSSFNALHFATAEGAPDNLVTHVVDHRQALLLGTNSAELWDNVGASSFPFIRNPSGFIEIGCLAGDTAQKIDQSVIWLANDLTVRRLQGITPVRVSTHALEKAMLGYTVASAYAFTYVWQGHLCYALNFPEATWIFDITTGQWHERKSFGVNYWRASCAIQLNGRAYVGDGLSNKLGLLDDVFKEWDDALVASWTYQSVSDGNRRLSHKRLEIIMESGVGLSTGQGSDPELMLDISDDGGRNFISLPSRKLGKIGNMEALTVWDRLGASRDRVYRASISDPVRRKLIDTQILVA